MRRFLPKDKRGFTLVELMVVIAILALLATVGITIYSGAQKSARDAKRKADIGSISEALEAHLNASTNQYCTGATGTYCAPVVGWFSAGAVPTDPINSGANVYSGLPSNGAASYNLCATLETGGATYCRANQQ